METLHAAEKYLCEGLMKICATYLADQLNTENVLYIYQRTCMYPEAGHQESGLAGRIDNRPSAPPLEEFNAPNAESPQANAQTQSRSTWCSFLLNSCLEFIDKNASAVLLSEVITTSSFCRQGCWFCSNYFRLVGVARKLK
jgi:hypothetical protein